MPKPRFPSKLENVCKKEFLSDDILYCKYEGPCEYHTKEKIPLAQNGIVGGREYGCKRK